MSILTELVWLFAAVLGANPVAGDSRAEWPQFRGPNSSARAVGAAPLPAELGPETNVIWKTALPPGHSSPVIAGRRIYLTGERDKKLWTIGIDCDSGKVLWEQVAPHKGLEEIHSIGSHAQSSPATDGERVVSFFGSSGLFCYDPDGNPLWSRPMGPFKNTFGAASSPMIVDDRVILGQDHDTDSFLMALDKRTGETIWRTDRSEFPRNYCSPIVWEVNGRKQIILAATLRVVGYDFETGKELWTVRGIARFVSATPVIGDDGNLYVAGWAAGGDEGERISIPAFETVADRDANKNGGLDEDELPEGDIKKRFTQVDRNKDLIITQAEYNYFRRLFDEGRNVVIAIRPGASGDATETHRIWEYGKFVPFCASPVYDHGYLFTVKDGGILSCLEAATGKPAKQGRISGTGDYYSSPVAGDGKIYLLNEDGELTVVSAVPRWETISTAKFEEPAYATPAIVDGRIYLRTAGHLYCFGLPAR